MPYYGQSRELQKEIIRESCCSIASNVGVFPGIHSRAMEPGLWSHKNSELLKCTWMTLIYYGLRGADVLGKGVTAEDDFPNLSAPNKHRPPNQAFLYTHCVQSFY